MEAAWKMTPLVDTVCYQGQLLITKTTQFVTKKKSSISIFLRNAILNHPCTIINYVIKS